MKILLINPPRSPINNILAYAPAEAKRFIHKKLIGPPLGLLTIAAAAKDHDVEVLEMKGEYDLHPDSPAPDMLVRSVLASFKPDVVGVTFIASEFYAGMDIFRTVKNFDPGIKTVAGGLHTVLSLRDFDDACVDFVCPGQSADVFMNLIHALEQNAAPDSVGGLYFRKDDAMVKASAPRSVWDACNVNFIRPDRSKIKKWISTYTVGGRIEPSTYIFTSLGCPHECSFCSIWPQFGKQFYQRDLESIIDELKAVDDYPIVRFSDANTIVDAAFISRLFDRILEEGIRKEYIMDIRFDTAVAYPELIEKLARGGLKVVICGFESYREEELIKYKKGADAKLISQAIEIFHKNGVSLRGNYVIPPDYTEDDFKAMADYASSHPVVYAGYTILTPMPGTTYYQEVKKNIIDHDLAKYNFFNSVMQTALPIEKFYENTGKLWLIKKGTDVI
ncbi:MAG: radical SAM protein [Bacteroidota bacterium]